MTKQIEAVVIGGGYAGVMAANRLTKRADVAVTLINPRAFFVERIRLHQLVGGSDDAVVDYEHVLADGVRLVVDAADRIDADQRMVTLVSGAAVSYDYLVYAVGSGTDEQQVPGLEFAYPLNSLEEAERLRSIVDNVQSVIVVGAGPAGIETAAELAGAGRPVPAGGGRPVTAEERRSVEAGGGRRVTLVCGGELGPYLHASGRRTVAARLEELGVQIVDGPGTAVAAVTRDAVQLADGRELPSELTIWTAGFGVPDLAVRSGLSTDALGRLLTDETLTSVDDERIVAAGDSAAPSGLSFRMGCQSAVQLGPQAAETVLNRIAGKKPADVGVGFAGQCISLGRDSGIFQFAHRNDVAISLHLRGRFGAKVKEMVCKSTVWQLRTEGRHPRVMKWWTKDGKRPRLVRDARVVSRQA
ncbi:NAD(P)/FAD-dependent oxidoreductase [Kribbella sp. DT2]|uniref:NAD(P)/FAD-dependent oxidoreductase n=1 Tax=Kribbella sp. DT2 TaxID=3393427 RepID=UPI003CF14ED3